MSSWKTPFVFNPLFFYALPPAFSPKEGLPFLGGGEVGRVEEVVIAIHPLSQQMFIEDLMPTKTVLGFDTIIGSKET